jgi:uncharacterized protein (TIRG00374 family)
LNKRTLWRTLGFITLILLLVGLFIWLVDLPEVGRVLQTADLTLLLFASLALITGLIIHATRWWILLANQTGLLPTFHASNLGHAGNVLIPAQAGEAVRIVAIAQAESVSLTVAASSFVVERLFEQIMRLTALAGAVVYGVGLPVTAGTIMGGLILLAAAFGGIAWLVRHQETVLRRGPKLLAKIPRLTEERAYQSLADLLANLAAVSAWRRLTAVILTSLLAWTCFWGFFYLTLLALGESFPPEQRLAVSLGALALSPPSAMTLPGIFHASVVGPLTAVGFHPETLTAYAVLIHILEMFWVIGLGLWGLWQTGLSPGDLFRREEKLKAGDQDSIP